MKKMREEHDLDADPFDIEKQKEIERRIHKQRINENLYASI
jgi:hypothetical protein